MRYRQPRRRWMLYLALGCALILPAKAAGAPLLDLLIEALPYDEDQAWFRDHANFDEIYRELRNTSLEIIKMYPPENFTYLSIGRSGTPVIAFLQQAGISGAHNIPLTGAALMSFYWNEAFYARRIDRFFREIFQKIEITNGKKILLLDYANSGLSLASFRVTFAQHLQKHGYRNRVASVALHGAWSAPALRAGSSFRYLKLSSSLDLLFYLEDFKEWAEYEPYVLVDPDHPRAAAKPLSTLKRQPLYEALSLWIRSMQEGDATLRRAYGPPKPAACPQSFARLRKR